MKKSIYQKDFILIVIGQIISLLGNTIIRFALPLYLLRVTKSAALFGLVSACSFLPMIILSLLGGVLADRMNKKNIMVTLDFLTAGIIAILHITLGIIPLVPLLIVVLMMLYGIQGAYQPTVQASIPALISDQDVISANAIVNQISSFANLVGPMIAGFLFGTWGINIILIVSLICFLFSAIMELFIKIPHTKRQNDSKIFKLVITDIKDSFSFMLHEKTILFKISILIFLFNLTIGALMLVGLPIVVINILGISDKLYGISQGVVGVGGIIGGLVSSIIGKKMKITHLYLTLTICSLLSLSMSLIFIFAFSNFVSFIIFTVICSLMMMLCNIFTIQILAFVQVKTPTELVGKVVSIILAISMCSQPIGQSIYGILFEKSGNFMWIIIIAAGIISSLMSLYSKRIFSEFID